MPNNRKNKVSIYIIAKRRLSSRYSQAVQSAVWSKDDRQWLSVEIRVLQSGFKGKYFHHESVKLWNWFPKELVKSTLLQVFKTQQDKVWSELIAHPALSRGLDKRPPEVCFKINYPVILW